MELFLFTVCSCALKVFLVSLADKMFQHEACLPFQHNSALYRCQKKINRLFFFFLKYQNAASKLLSHLILLLSITMNLFKYKVLSNRILSRPTVCGLSSYKPCIRSSTSGRCGSVQWLRKLDRHCRHLAKLKPVAVFFSHHYFKIQFIRIISSFFSCRISPWLSSRCLQTSSLFSWRTTLNR